MPLRVYLLDRTSSQELQFLQTSVPTALSQQYLKPDLRGG